ncbi:MAG: cell division protein FtsQ/DivIB, partial [Lachnospirales bacterium]
IRDHSMEEEIMENQNAQQYMNYTIDDGEKKEPTRRVKKRRKKNYTLRLFALVLFIIGSIYLMSLDYFDIETIKVTGNNTITKEQVLKEAGIKKGNNLFAINKRRVVKKMKKNPYYSSVRVNKNLPNEIVLEIEERVPSVALPYGGKFVILDEQGVVLGLKKENQKLTQVTGITIKTMDKGKSLEPIEKEDFAKALSIIKTARENDLFFKSIRIDKEKVVANVYDGLSVKGDVGEVLLNMTNGNLRDILYDLYTKGIRRGTVRIVEGKYCSFTPTVE